MAIPIENTIAQYFKKGAEVEISSNDEGFSGSWYEGTVIRPPKNFNKSTNKVLVEYKTLMADESGTRRLREEIELINLRPFPPSDRRHHRYKLSEEVDAYCNEGWWEGIITEEVVVGNDNKYLVYFRRSREQIDFRASELRVHREWVGEKWIPPLEEDDDLQNEKVSLSAEVKPEKEKIEHNYSPGELIEVRSDEDGLEGAWFGATVVKELGSGKYLVEYQSLKDDDDDTKLLTEEVDDLHIRPYPPYVGLVDRFEAHEEVDALYNDAWWVGVICKVLKDDKYSVYFASANEVLKFKHTDLRVHQEWKNRKWSIATKALKQ